MATPPVWRDGVGCTGGGLGGEKRGCETQGAQWNEKFEGEAKGVRIKNATISDVGPNATESDQDQTI
ncbi:hypothetical protein KPH14_001557 [Odynerus spinipes]|uniref:Uncharacterized protein n=1 Tax=Odynerus spinipes TaxID=1348599 RepID=A0AAD9RZ93_9HYME|nr:hypothetical protein KPH14_001557 [Odynerus spinipes]